MSYAQSLSVSTTDHAARASSFSAFYRDNVDAITSFFARKVDEPQLVADLVSETFVEAIGSLGTFDPARGTPRAWLFAIARRVFARWYVAELKGRRLNERVAGRLELDEDDLDGLAQRIDRQAEGRRLLSRCAGLPVLERSAVELVDLAGLTPREAAQILGVAPGTLRVRLHRAHVRLRREGARDG
jgi:RNA polymerase sigma-70 factor (ECF subfamily)